MPARSPHSAPSCLENPSLFLLPEQVCSMAPAQPELVHSSGTATLTSHRPTWQVVFWLIQYLWPMLGYCYQMLGPIVCHKLGIAHLQCLPG